jgi:coenzyme F420-reducing hydrogenase delta subunit/Pyruvate/2-oxoacid:ferredoxin oxidoreductase delta subunit
MSTCPSRLRITDEHLTGVFDYAFAPAHNPWRHLGALAFLCLAISVASGVVAFALYDTSVSGAYDSGLRLQDDPTRLGRLLRGIHRYAADAFMLLSVLHLVRETLRGHFRGVRWFSWITGVPLMWMLWLAGITGLWLLWDERSLFSITATAEWLQALPLASDQLARNFLTPDALNDRFFSLIMFMHIGVPLLLLAAVWVHVQRVALPRIWPPGPLIIGSLATLSILALSIPAQSLGRAATGQIPAMLPLDWFYLFPHPLVDRLSADSVWFLAAVLTIAIAALPWIRLSTREAHTPTRVARVDLANCNGCSRCAADCPFGAVVMVPRTDGRRHPQQAEVIADLCAACGICVGACPSSTPFRRLDDLVSGIEMPDTPIASMKRLLQEKMAVLSEPDRIVLFGCRQAANLATLADASTAVLMLECAGMLPPSFIEYATRMGATGIVVAGCREADCEYRYGDRWVQARIQGLREPHLRSSVPRHRLRVIWTGQAAHQVRQVITALRRHTPISRNQAAAIESDEAHHE